MIHIFSISLLLGWSLSIARLSAAASCEELGEEEENRAFYQERKRGGIKKKMSI